MKKMIYNSPEIEMIEIQALSCLMASDPDGNPTDVNSDDFGAPKRSVF